MDHRKKFSSLKEDHWNISSVLLLISSYFLEWAWFRAWRPGLHNVYSKNIYLFSASGSPRDEFLMRFFSEFNNGLMWP